MTTTVDIAWQKALTLVKSAGDATLDQRTETPGAAVGKPDTPVAVGDPISSGVMGGLEDIASGKSAIIDVSNILKPRLGYQLSGDEQKLFDAGKHEDLARAFAQRYVPSDITKADPAALARFQRAALGVRSNAKLSEPFAKQRVFGPQDATNKLTLEEIEGQIANRIEGLTDEERQAYDKQLYPDQFGEAQLIQQQAAAAVQQRTAEVNKAINDGIKQVDADPEQKQGFMDWALSSWGNIAVPVGALLMLFGGNVGRIVGGLAIAAGGANLYDRYKTLTGDPAAQTAALEYAKSGFSKKKLEEIRAQFGPRIAQASQDYYGLMRYGFMEHVQSATVDAALRRYRAYHPRATKAELDTLRQKLTQNTIPTTNTNNWGSAGIKAVQNFFNPPQQAAPVEATK